MKSIVVFKWVKNPQDARVGADGSTDWRGVKMAPNDDDPAAIKAARDIAATKELVGLTIGDGDVAWAAARGASNTVVVTDADTNADSAATGAILAACVRHIGDADVVFIGDCSWDYGVISALAGQLGWPALAQVVSVNRTEDGCFRVTRKVGSGTQVVDVKGPAVFAVAASRAEQHAPGMKEVLVARKKPVDRLSVADLNVILPAPTITSRGTKLPDRDPAQMIDGSDPAAAAKQLLTALHSEGVL